MSLFEVIDKLNAVGKDVSANLTCLTIQEVVKLAEKKIPDCRGMLHSSYVNLCQCLRGEPLLFCGRFRLVTKPEVLIDMGWNPPTNITSR